MTVIDIARLFLHVRETTQNQGQRVNAIQVFSGGTAALGTSWCAWFVTMVLDLAYGGQSPIPRMGSVQDILDVARQHGWVVNVPEVGDLFVYVNDAGHGHHVGFVSNLEPLNGLAGNTSADGTSDNGDRVADHGITAHVFIHLEPPT